MKTLVWNQTKPTGCNKGFWGPIKFGPLQNLAMPFFQDMSFFWQSWFCILSPSRQANKPTYGSWKLRNLISHALKSQRTGYGTSVSFEPVSTVLVKPMHHIAIWTIQLHCIYMILPLPCVWICEMDYSHTAVCTCWAISPMYVQYTLNKPFKCAPFWWSCLTSHHHVLLSLAFLKGVEVTLVAFMFENHSSVSLLCHQTRSCCRYWEKKLTAQLRKFLRENKSNKIIEI